jgi:hypothetical protein
MPLNEALLNNGIKALLTDMETRTEDAKGEFANRLAALIKSFVMSGTVTVSAGIPVATSGSATNQAGATTATGTGTIS